MYKVPGAASSSSLVFDGADAVVAVDCFLAEHLLDTNVVTPMKQQKARDTEKMVLPSLMTLLHDMDCGTSIWKQLVKALNAAATCGVGTAGK